MKILLLNYYWPPCGGPAVQRWLYLVKNLTALGFECHVLTVDPKKATFPAIDYGLESLVPAQTRVYRTPTTDYLAIYARWFNRGKSPAPATGQATSFGEKAARFVRSNFFLPDPRIGWNRYALTKALEIIEKENIRLVITAGPPHSTHLVGQKLQRLKKVVWVCDVHDYWTNISYLKNFYRTRIAHAIDSALERKALTSCHAAMTDCRSARRYFGQKYGSAVEQKFFVHTIGYDEQLFESPEKTDESRFLIAYTGTIAKFYGAEAFFEGLSQAHTQLPEAGFRVVFAGNADSHIRSLPQKFKLEEVTEFLGYIPHKESVKLLQRASALFLVNPMYEGEKIHVPGKLYEYLAAEKPIINLAPTDGESAEIIAQYQAGKTFERHQAADIARYLVELAYLKINGLPLPKPLPTYRKHGRMAEARQVARWLEGLV